MMAYEYFDPYQSTNKTNREIFRHIPMPKGRLNKCDLLDSILGSRCESKSDYLLVYRIIVNDLVFMGAQEGNRFCIELSSHIEDMVNVIWYEDFRNEYNSRNVTRNILIPYASILQYNDMDVPDFVLSAIRNEGPQYALESFGYILSLKIKGIKFENCGGRLSTGVHRAVTLFD